VVLLNPEPISFESEVYRERSIRPGIIPSLDISGLKTSPEPYGFFRDIQRLVISLLQDRSYPLWKRLFRVGLLCEKLDEADGRDGAGTLQRFSSSRRIRKLSSERCWTSKSTMSEMGKRYTEAFHHHYSPFMTRHKHILEHYLVTYVHRTLFPFGILESNQRMRNDRVSSFITARYMLMVAYYAITQTLLVGNAGYHKSAFGAGHVLKAIQSCTKTFEHSMTYPARAIGMLAEKSMTAPASLCVLMVNP
jgi:lysine-N-methylase